MNKLLVLLFFMFLAFVSRSQNNPTYDRLQQLEAGIKGYASDIVNAPEMIDRFRADSLFTRGLVQALKTPYSFGYSFDSLLTISTLYAPDSSFKIFTWQVMKDFSFYRQKGAIQIHTNDGSLKLYPLFDFSEYTDNPTDSIRTNNNWIGAVYYNIIQKTYNNKKFYTLLGYDENNAKSTKKWIEVLSFDQLGKPVFGGAYFSYPPDNLKPVLPAQRFCLEFKKQAGAKLNYEPSIDRIIFAHLVSENGEPKEKQTLIPYGTYEGFKWLNGKWVYDKTIESLLTN